MLGSVGAVTGDGPGDIRRLVYLLRALQGELGANQKEMAERLGVSEGTLSLVYRGRRRPGAQFLRCVLRSFPELYEEVRCFLEPGYLAAVEEDKRGA